MNILAMDKRSKIQKFIKTFATVATGHSTEKTTPIENFLPHNLRKDYYLLDFLCSGTICFLFRIHTLSLSKLFYLRYGVCRHGWLSVESLTFDTHISQNPLGLPHLFLWFRTVPTLSTRYRLATMLIGFSKVLFLCQQRNLSRTLSLSQYTEYTRQSVPFAFILQVVIFVLAFDLRLLLPTWKGLPSIHCENMCSLLICPLVELRLAIILLSCYSNF